MRKVLILTDQKGWHFNQLQESFLRKKVTVESYDLTELTLSFMNNENKIFHNNKELNNVTDVIVRFIPNGTLEEIVTYLNILKIFKMKGANVINTAENIELTVDKSLTTALLNHKNINTPKTWVIRGKRETKNLVSKLLKEYRLIYKPIFGSQGNNIKKIERLEDLDSINNVSNIYYLQEFLNTEPFHDYRVLIVKSMDKTKIFSMIRYGKSYINNFSKGAKCVPIKLDKKMAETALLASEIVDLPLCGIDIIKQKDKFFIIEVNGIPAWKGLQSINKENIADVIVNAFLNASRHEEGLSIKPVSK